MINKVTTVEARHIFLDIVSYTHGRSIEAQTDLIGILNRIVKASIRNNKIKRENLIYIPTGDGMCITIINKPTPYDVHLLIGLDILRLLQEHNESSSDEMRKFSIRIGINENTDNLVTDINLQKNISGSGINSAARILTLCDSNQILVSVAVFDKLVQREKYIKSFRKYTGVVKHGITLAVYQYLNPVFSFLNNQIPIAFAPKIAPTTKMSEEIGYYIANCILSEDFIAKNIHHPQAPYTLICLMFHLAEDNISKARTTKTNPRPSTIKTKRHLQEEFDYYQTLDFWLIADFSSFIKKTLIPFEEYFTEGYLFVNSKGRQKIIELFPSIVSILGIKVE